MSWNSSLQFKVDRKNTASSRFKRMLTEMIYNNQSNLFATLEDSQFNGTASYYNKYGLAMPFDINVLWNSLIDATRYAANKEELINSLKVTSESVYNGQLQPMIEAIKQYCQKTGQPVPETVGELAAVVYRSLAQSYGETVKELETIAGRIYDSIHIIGGGSNAAYLNQLTADATGKTVYAGPGEATAIGNLLAQMIHAGDLADLKGARQCVRDSFEIKTYVPAD